MTQEEKAKAYDEAIERAKEWYSDAQIGIGFKVNLEKLFPELEEDRDERIRKAIIEFFELQDDNTTFSLIPKKDILAWLKKQGERKPAWSEEDEKMVKDIIAAIDALYYHGMVNWLKSLKERIG